MRQFYRIIVDQADHMRGVISDLLDAGRIDSGTLSVSSEPSDLASLVDQARNTFLSGGGLQTVLIDLPPELSRVMADRRRIVQVLNNLFSNAARHAPESSPIRVAALREGVHVAVSVSDQGRGVTPERDRSPISASGGQGRGVVEVATLQSGGGAPRWRTRWRTLWTTATLHSQRAEPSLLWSRLCPETRIRRGLARIA